VGWRVTIIAPRRPPPPSTGLQAAPLNPAVAGIVVPVTENTFKPHEADKFPHPRRGPADAPIMVICDSPTIDAMRQGLPASMDELGWFAQRASKQGFVPNDIQFVTLCAPIKQTDLTSAKRKWDHVSQYEERVRQIVEEANPAVVVTCGELATRVMMGRAVKITKSRGVVTKGKYSDRNIFPILSPKMVRRQPDNIPVFDADLGTLSRLKQGGYDPTSLQLTDVDYQWCVNLDEMMLCKPKALAIDTENWGGPNGGSGLNYRHPDFTVCTVQLSTGPGHARVIPTWDYYKRWEAEFNAMGITMTYRSWANLKAQLKTLLEDASITKMAHNFKYDNGALSYGMGIDVNGWEHDSELATRAVNENMMSYSLDDCVRIYVPEMSGYADLFNQMVDKSRMIDVPPNDEFDAEGKIVRPGMLSYAGGDPDAVYRLMRAVYPMLRRERGQMFLYQQVQMRGLLSFAKRIENYGQCIDRAALEEYETEVYTWVQREEQELFELIPAAVRRKWLTDPAVIKDLEKRGERSIPSVLFGKDKFLIDVLFGEEGFKLKPQVFTPSTAKLPDDQKVPSTSTKDHLPYFVNERGVKGEFVNRYRDFKKAQTLHSKYIKNFYKYIKPANDNSGEEKIYPSYNFRTNTSRTNSQDPNGQNFPKRGGKKVDFAKGFMRLIKASAGKVLIAADMSQVELRLTAWSAMEQNMLRIYNTGGDIHEATAAAVMRLSVEEFRALDAAVKKLQRFRAKAVNFGFIYGAMARTFQIYAKTQYEVDYTLREAEETRDIFFDKYKLIPWHGRVEEYVKAHGYVNTLHGGVRHLPAVWSTDWQVSTEAVRQAINAPIQRMGSDLGVIAINRLAAQVDPRLMRPVGFVHDQLIAEVDPGYVEQCMGWLCWVMENPPLEEWFGIRAPLPFVADPEFGPNLATTTEVSRSDIDIVQPEWWNVNEDEAYEAFMRNETPDWLSTREVNPPLRVRRMA
jgi:DNA polymerase I-like protein with 3'-5' exonuclease and polymerase domains/uracil-DNA glycosylase